MSGSGWCAGRRSLRRSENQGKISPQRAQSSQRKPASPLPLFLQGKDYEERGVYTPVATERVRNGLITKEMVRRRYGKECANL
jgi:hypothetical protein